MTPQYFKGNAEERKVDYCGQGAMDLTGLSLDQFYIDAFECTDFLLMLYDEGRVPFSDRVPRAAFVNFLIQCIANANFIGTYESYIFLINGIFGEGSSIFFTETDPGVVTMIISSSATIRFGFVTRELVDGAYEYFDMVTGAGETLEFAGLPGIDSEAELKQLLAEFIPAGIYADITLVIFTTYLFLVEDVDGESTINDGAGNDIIFFELGG